LKVPRQCPPVLVVKVNWTECKALGSEEGKTIRSEFFVVMEYNKEVDKVVYCIRAKFWCYH
jgi:hypothetical protein